jgi:hypothetical protein
VILLDAGYSDFFIEKRRALGNRSERVTDLVLSHGHIDIRAGSARCSGGFRSLCGFRAFRAFWPKRYVGLDAGFGAAEALIQKRGDMAEDKPCEVSDT